jgi:hypothetical protein
MRIAFGLTLAVMACLFNDPSDPSWKLEPYVLPAQAQQALEGLAAESDVLILGELHGTQEVATISASLLGPLKTQGYSALALELPTHLKPALLDWASGKTQTVPNYFTQPSQDGRSNIQTLALIRLAVSEHGWGLICFDDPAAFVLPEKGPVDFVALSLKRDAAMATSLTRQRKTLAGNPKVLAICGNIHARTAKSADPQNSANKLWPSFAAALQIDLPTWRVRSVNIVPHGGTFFAAIGTDDDPASVIAKVHPIRSAKPLETAELRQLEKGQWDRELHLPRATAATFLPSVETPARE